MRVGDKNIIRSSSWRETERVGGVGKELVGEEVGGRKGIDGFSDVRAVLASLMNEASRIDNNYFSSVYTVLRIRD